MSKGHDTRQAILQEATVQASQNGLSGITIGKLADALQMSKSGVFAHFKSKDMLQVATLTYYAEVFTDRVVRPALKAPRGEVRLRSLFSHWLAWASTELAYGCLFVSAATELDDRPGPARDILVSQQKDWLDVISQVAKTGIQEGDFRADVDPDQIAFEIYGIALSLHHALRLLGQRGANQKAWAAFDRLVADARLTTNART